MFSKDRITKEQEKQELQKNHQRDAYKLRVQHDLDGLDQMWSDGLQIEDSDLINKMTLTLVPREGIWKDHPLVFEINIPNDYPYQPPIVKCLTRIFHPNIDLNGVVCMPILRHDWSTSYSLNVVFLLLYLLFIDLSLCPHHCVNNEAGKLLLENAQEFERKAMDDYMKGNYE